MDDTGQIGPGNSARFSNRHPIFGERYTLPWLEEGISLLIAEKTGLQLNVSTVVIRQRFAPIQPVGINSPGPDFLGRKIRIIRKMSRTRIRVGIPYTHVILTGPMTKKGNRSIGLVPNDAQVLAAFVDRPFLHFCKTMGRGKAHRVLNVGIIPHLDTGIVPPVEAMAHVTPIA